MRPVLVMTLLVSVLAGCADPAPEPWTVQELGTDAEFRDAFFLDAERGWIVGGGYNIEGGILGSTVDGGRTWSFRSGLVRPSARSSLFRFHGVQFLDERLGFMVGDGGFILRTVDGGENWHPIRRGPRVSSHLFDLHFVDEEYGWAVGWGGVHRTVDGGETWTTRIGDDPDREYRPAYGLALHFQDRRHGWLVGKSGKIMRTTDGGATWSVVGDPPESGRADLRAVTFTDLDHGWVVGDYAVILHTEDGGRTWVRQTSGSGASLTDVRFVDRLRGWAIGYDRSNGTSTVLYTDDGGETWIQQFQVDGEELQALVLLDADHGLAVGDRVRRGPQKLLRYARPE